MNPEPGMFIPTGKIGYYQILGMDDEGATLKQYGSALASPFRVSYRELDSLVIQHGLCRRTGRYQFDRADDLAVACIRYATENPQAAGRELYRLRKLVEGKE